MAKTTYTHPDIYEIARGRVGTDHCAHSILGVLRERQRPMSYSLIKSRVSGTYTAAEIAASLIDLIERGRVRHAEGDHILYELED